MSVERHTHSWMHLEVSRFGSVIALNSSISISPDVVIVAASVHQEQLGLCNRTSLLYCGSYGGLCASRSSQLSRNQGSPCASGCAKATTKSVMNPRTQSPTPITLHACLAYTGEPAFMSQVLKCVALSLDFYLTNAEQTALGRCFHDIPLLQYRGNAGTHRLHGYWS
jgi:hypothetical protein